MSKKLVTISQLSEAIGISVMTIRRRIKAETLPYTRANSSTKSGKLLFDAELVQELLRREALSNVKQAK